jgi:hypothetical protein
MKHNMIVWAIRAEHATMFRLIVFLTDQNAPGVWLQLDAVWQISQSPFNLTDELDFS